MTREEAKEWLDTIIARYEVEDEWVTLCDRRYYIAIKTAIKALEQEPCEDAISRQAVLDMMQMRMSGKELYKAVYELPSVNPQPKTGHWKIKRASIHPYGNDVACSECGFTMGSSFGYSYCPSCGARMESEA